MDTIRSDVLRPASWLDDEPALIGPTGTVSYVDLRRRVGALAALLAAWPAGELVGIHAATPVQAIIAVYAALRAGLGYVVLDPSHPPQRLRSLADQADINLVLTDGTYPGPARTIDLRTAADDGNGDREDADRGTLEQGDEDPRPAAARDVPANAIAYTAFTSGSTGEPKGVLVPRSAVAAHVASLAARWPLGPGDRLLQLTPLAFDAAVTDILWPLHAGATVVVPGPHTHRDPVAIARALIEHAITAVRVPPVLLPALLEQGEFAASRLRYLICGGDVLPPAVRDDVLARRPGLTLLHRYGPTEATVAVTYHEAQPGTPETFVPLGTPVDGSTITVLDDALHEATTGELWISGDGLSHGYLHRPAATAAAFRPDPAGPPGARRYRTGDRADRLPDGELRFLGRRDRQVKVRGLRLELGEIEAVLRTHPDVRDAAVEVGRSGDGVAWLVAHVVPLDGLEDRTLRTYLRERLPDYMLPSRIELRDALPLDERGKVDHFALSSDPSRGPGATGGTMADVWRDLLGVDPAPDDDFFDLGGHSLLALSLVSRVRRDQHLDVSVADVFAQSTLAGFSALAATRPEVTGLDRSGVDAVSVPRRPDGVPVPLTFGQERLWFLETLRPGRLSYNSQSVFRFTGGLDAATVRFALDRLVERHESLRTTFPSHDGQASQVVHPPCPADLVETDLSGQPALTRHESADALTAAFIRRTFDLTRLPLIRWLFIDLGDGETWLVQSEHHLLHDGWSLAVLTGEFLELCTAYREGRPAQLPALGTQLADFACWQRGWLSGGALDHQLDYWRRTLRGTPPLALGKVPGRVDAPVEDGGCVRVPLSAERTARILAACRRARVTEFMVGLTAYTAWLHGATGQSDFAVGVSLANRRTVDTDRVIGCVLNNQAIRMAPRPRMTLAELAQDVRASTLDCLENQDVPFHLVVQALGLRRSTEVNPVFQVAFNSHSATYPPNRIPGVTFAATEAISNGSVKFPLHAVLVRHAEMRRPDWTPGDPERMEVHWFYSHAYFTDDDARVAVRDYLAVLDALVDGDDRPLADVVAGIGDVGGIEGRDPAPPEPADPAAAVLDAVRAICAEILDLPDVAAQANFFDLGGHSLLAVRFAARIQDRLHAEVPVSAIFEADTVADIAALTAAGVAR